MTDGRFSGATHGFMIGHVAPEAADGGPIAALKDGDVIVIDIKKRRLDVELDDAALERRLNGWQAPKPHYETGALAKYARLVGDASHGAITDAPERAPYPCHGTEGGTVPGATPLSVNVSITEMRSCWLPLPGTPCSTAWPRRTISAPTGSRPRICSTPGLHGRRPLADDARGDRRVQGRARASRPRRRPSSTASASAATTTCAGSSA